MKNPILRQSLLFLFCWRLRRHFVALCATQLLTSSFLLQAQAPQGIPYQAIARNSSGVAIANTAVKVRFSIRDSIATGAIKYQETHNPTTSALGLFSVNVGMGTAVSGTFSGINWGKNAKFLQVELNTTGGTTFTDLGTTQMMSVPYALQANAIKMKTSVTGDTLYTGGGNYLIIPGISAANPILNQPEAPVTDIDGNVYQTVRIGTQIWMKENLKVSKFKNGNIIQHLESDSAWSQNLINNTRIPAWCYQNLSFQNNPILGKLYNGFAVSDNRGLCPQGWRIPKDSDWDKLVKYLNPNSDTNNVNYYVAVKLASADFGVWEGNPPMNISGFTGMPSGGRESDAEYNYAKAVRWWSKSDDPNYSNFYAIYEGDPYLGITNYVNTVGLSVRCLKD